MVDTARDQRWGRNIEGAGEELQFLQFKRPQKAPKPQNLRLTGRHGKRGPFPGGGNLPEPASRASRDRT